MNWKTYQRLAGITGKSNQTLRESLMMAGLGIAGESGEIVDHIKKLTYHDHPIDRAALTKEIGDLVWYVAYLLDQLDISMDDVLEANIAKLRTRYPNGFSEERSQNREKEADA